MFVLSFKLLSLSSSTCYSSVSSLILQCRLGPSVFAKMSDFSTYHSIFTMVLDDSKWCKMCLTVGESNLKQIISKSRSSQILDFILDHSKWDDVVSKLGFVNAIKLSSVRGCFDVFNIFVNSKSWSFLRSFFDVNQLIKIASVNFSSSVFDILLNPIRFHSLCSHFSKDSLCLISSRKDAAKVLEMFSDGSSWTTLVRRIGLDLLLKLSVSDSAFHIFSVVTNDFLWSKLLQRIDSSTLRCILRNSNPSKVIDLILDDSFWAVLLNRMSKKSLLAFSRKRGAFKTLSFIHDSSRWSSLLSQIPLNDALLLSRNDSPYSIFKFILNESKWPMVCSRLGRDTSIQFAPLSGSRHVFDLICKDSSWELILNRLDGCSFSRIVSIHGAVKTFNFLLDNSCWNTLLKRIGRDCISNVLVRGNPSVFFEVVLNSKNWNLLQKQLTSIDIIKLSSTFVTKSIFDFILDPVKWRFLISKLGYQNVVSICLGSLSSSVLDILFDSGKFSTLNSRLGVKGIVSLASKSDGRLFLEFILNSHNWDILNNLFGDRTVSFLSGVTSIDTLYEIIYKFQCLNRYFDAVDLQAFSKLSYQNQKGFSSESLSTLCDDFKFTSHEVLLLSKFSGRHFHNILSLLSSHFDDVQSFFLEPPCLVSIDVPKSTVSDVFLKKTFFFYLVLMHFHTSSFSLTSIDLNSIKPLINKSSSLKLRFNYIFKILALTASFSPIDRRLLWGNLKNRGWCFDYSWLSRLSKLSSSTLSWYIYWGPQTFNTLLSASPSHSSKHNFLSISKQNNILHCLEHGDFRSFYFDQFSSHSSFFSDKLAHLNFSLNSESKTVMSCIDSFKIVVQDWLFIVLKLYDFISNSVQIFNSSSKLPSIFSIHDINKFKLLYPKIYFNSGLLTIDLSINALRFILGINEFSKDSCFKESKISKNSMKRSSPDPIFSSAKRICLESSSSSSSSQDLDNLQEDDKILDFLDFPCTVDDISFDSINFSNSCFDDFLFPELSSSSTHDSLDLSK